MCDADVLFDGEDTANTVFGNHQMGWSSFDKHLHSEEAERNHSHRFRYSCRSISTFQSYESSKKKVEHSTKQKHQGYPLWKLSKKALLKRPLELQRPCFQPNVCLFWNRRWHQVKGDLFVVLCLMHTWKHQRSGLMIQKWILVTGCIGYQKAGCKESELIFPVERTWNVTCLWF